MASQGQPSTKVIFSASLVGTAIEWYDYNIFGTVAALAFGVVFFPDFSPLAGTLAAFATFAVGFGARSLGAAVIGHFGDRVGRKAMLVLTLLLTGVATTLIGVLPIFAAIGVAAPLLLVLLRVVQGFGVGGECQARQRHRGRDQHRRGRTGPGPAGPRRRVAVGEGRERLGLLSMRERTERRRWTCSGSGARWASRCRTSC